MQVEPDYFIDRPPSAVFVPDEEGADKSTFMDDRKEPELYSFENEVRPVLQVLVGKALELAQIEVLEAEENRILAAHKANYKKRREAELMCTQRVEAARNRRTEETERRNIQQRTM